MKLETALKHIGTIRERLLADSRNGAGGQFERVFVFGSVMRGKSNPNDVDILYVGACCENDPAIKALTTGMRAVNIHKADNVSVDFKRMIEIFPAFNLDIKHPPNSVFTERAECGIVFPEEKKGVVLKFPNLHKYMKRRKLTKSTAIHHVIDRYCRLHKITMTGDDSRNLVYSLYRRYGWQCVGHYKMPGRAWGSAFRVNFPLAAHPDNLLSDTAD